MSKKHVPDHLQAWVDARRKFHIAKVNLAASYLDCRRPTRLRAAITFLISASVKIMIIRPTL